MLHDFQRDSKNIKKNDNLYIPSNIDDNIKNNDINTKSNNNSNVDLTNIDDTDLNKNDHIKNNFGENNDLEENAETVSRSRRPSIFKAPLAGIKRQLVEYLLIM